MLFDLLVGLLSYCIASYDPVHQTRKTNSAELKTKKLREESERL